MFGMSIAHISLHSKQTGPNRSEIKLALGSALHLVFLCIQTDQTSNVRMGLWAQCFKALTPAQCLNAGKHTADDSHVASSFLSILDSVNNLWLDTELLIG